jgi:prepilin-type N-terminal cleavage/methylation domain-containing protein/prepilin-type processing-associated H-X9-DG protein
MKSSIKSEKRIFGFTLIELLVVIAIIALLMGILLPAMTRVRRQGKRAACLAHTRQLQIAWQSYAETYEGKIVNGGQAPWPPLGGLTYEHFERFWCTGFPTSAINGYDWNWNPNVNYGGLDHLTYQQRVDKMKEGALFPYLKDVKIYRCTEARKDFHRTWSIVESMNSKWPGLGQYFGGEGQMNYNLGGIRKPSERIVFIEEGNPSSDAFMVIHDVVGGQWIWIDKPQAPHVKGSNFSFADGHAEYWKWEDKRTLAWAGIDWTEDNPGSTIPDATPDNKDLVKVIIATWGDIKNYTPKK